ncbi:reducing type I polyketide synthase [Polyplosphaeria fusca]|uniref:Reducing type I polyketide synthase n=1 Tax=Polyplosphaeria fusca TaxID=682080 RepID=A0A9P4UUD4_9PLEO|nr:reducing type I polyketide synthase [Polyplosphaeria fusca]
MDGNGCDDIAIVGFDFTFPGDVVSEESLWDMLISSGVDEATLPGNRLWRTSLDSSDVAKWEPGARAHFLREDISAFDAPFFSITPAEAEGMDPQQRKLLETTYKALENGKFIAGISVGSLRGSKTSVHIGCFTGDYNLVQCKDPESMPTYHATGNSGAILSNRISWFFDLKGPSVTMDTACSSSMVALDQACQALHGNRTNLGIVGGCNTICTPESLDTIGRMGFLSPDAQCHSFDERASGYARAEGFGVIILKRVSDAVQNGDTIRAIIRATATNQDGRTIGLAQPNPLAQEELIRSTYKNAGLDMNLTRFVESHGTGTAVGDPIEANALERALQSERTSRSPVYIGATKANIGHLEACSGIAGIIKTVMVLEKGIIPPIAQLKKLNQRIDAPHLIVRLLRSPVKFPNEKIRRASVQSFGFGGTNAHAVLDDAGSYLQHRGLSGLHLTKMAPTRELPKVRNIEAPQYKLLVWSAPDKAGLKRLTARYHEYLNALESKRSPSCDMLNNIAYTLGQRRSTFAWKASSIVTLEETGATHSKALDPSPRSIARKLCLVFTGQGAYWDGMGRELMDFASFERSIMECQKHLVGMGFKWSLPAILCGKVNPPDQSATTTQTVCTALQVALVDLLRNFGIQMSHVVGHSSGEIAAAYCVGAIDLEAAMSLAFHRGRLSDMLATDTNFCGSMMAVGLAVQDMQKHLNELKARFGACRVDIGCVNSPVSVTVSGQKDQIDSLKIMLDEEGAFARILRVPVAYHSSQMSAIAEAYANSIQDLSSGGPDVRDATMISSVTGMSIQENELRQPDYWVTNLTSSVQFHDSVLTLLSENGGECFDFLEVGPHSTLLGPVTQILKDAATASEFSYHSMLKRFRPANLTTTEAMGNLYTSGHFVNVFRVNNLRDEGRYATVQGLPSYPFDISTKYWAESRISKGIRFRKYGHHDLLGTPVADWNELEPRWSLKTRLDRISFLEDHRINGTLIYPAAGMIAAAMQGAHQLSAEGEITGYEVRNAEFLTALMAPKDANRIEIELRFRKVQTKESANMNRSAYEFRLYSFHDEAWVQHCQGEIRVLFSSSKAGIRDREQPADEYERICSMHNDTCAAATTSLDTDMLYSNIFQNFGYEYGETFRLLQDMHCDSASNAAASLAALRGDAKARASIAQPHVIHPAALDAILQLALVAASQGGQRPIPTIIPERIHKLWISASGLRIPDTDAIRANAKSVMRGARKMEASASAFDANTGEVLVKVDLFEGTAVAGNTQAEKIPGRIPQLCFRMDWQPDIDHLAPEQLLDHCWDGIRRQGEEAAIVDFERDALVVIFHALFTAQETMARDSITPAKPHLERYVKWMRIQTAAFLSDKYPNVRTRYNTIVRDPSKLSAIYHLTKENKMWRLYTAVAENLIALISGALDPLQLLFGQSYATDFYLETNLSSRCVPAMQRYLSLLAHKRPNLRYLEVGAGTGSITQLALSALVDASDAEGAQPTAQFSRYVFTDISHSFVAAAQEAFGAKHQNMRFEVCDLERAPVEQGFEGGGYDVVIAGSVLHATSDIARTLRHVRALLKPGGKLVLHENVKPEHVRMGFAFGLLSGWWLGIENYRQQSPCLTVQGWERELRASGFSGVDVEFRDFVAEECHEISVMVTTAVEKVPQPPQSLSVAWPLIIADTYDAVEFALAEKLRIQMQKSMGLDCFIGSLEAMASSPAASGRPCIVLNEVLPPKTESRYLAIRTLFRSASSILWVSGRCGPEPFSAGNGLIEGLARVARRENIHLRLALLGSGNIPGSKSPSCDNILKVFSQMLQQDDYEPEYIDRNGALNISRVKQAPSFNAEITREAEDIEEGSRAFGDGVPLRLTSAESGTLLSDMHYVEDTDCSSIPLAPDDIEIEVKATGCNFMDALTAIGRLERSSIGLEASGIVSRVGAAVSTFAPGDRVVAFSLDSFRTYARTKAALAVPLPASLDFSDGASFPINFGTAYRALVDVAHLETGQTVLIHSAAGGTGQAAVQIAKYLGADIFATVGSQEKKELLATKYGIPLERIYSSRDSSFLDGIKRQTKNCGIDVVLNSLSGELLEASWECVAAYGRFIEIGKKDIRERTKIDMSPFANNVTFASVDLEAMIRERPDATGKTLSRVMGLLLKGAISPPDVHMYAAGDVEEALRHLLSGNSTGKVLVEYKKDTVVQAKTGIKRKYELECNATYLLAGGLGGLGKSVAKWMVRRGARHLLLLSRSGNADSVSSSFVQHLEAAGVQVETYACDIGDAAALSGVLKQCRSSMPPIRGCVQASMILKDSTFSNMSYDDFNAPLASKVHGSWNLHQQLPPDLAFFIMLSSISGIFGSGGQGNYAAGNTYQDALAHHRVSMGQKAASLDLGMMESEGYLAHDPSNMLRLAKSDGLQSMPLEALFALLEHYCDPNAADDPQLITGLGIPTELQAKGVTLPWWMSQPMFRNMGQIQQEQHMVGAKNDANADKAINFAQEFQKATEMQPLVDMVKVALVERLSHIIPGAFGNESEAHDTKAKVPIYSLGVDSLVAVELRNWFAKEVGADIATFEILGNVTVDGLAELAVSKSRFHGTSNPP